MPVLAAQDPTVEIAEPDFEKQVSDDDYHR
jgi:hypothetical protein